MTPERLAVAFGAAPIEAQIEAGARVLRRVSIRRFELEARRASVPARHHRSVDRLDADRDRRTAPSRRPPAQWFWEAAVRSLGDHAALGGVAATASRSSPVTLAWLTQKIAGSSAKERRDRFEMVRFAQARVREHRRRSRRRCAGRARRIPPLSRDPADARSHGRSPRRASIRALVEAARRLDEDLSGRDEKHAVIAFQVGAGDPRARAAHRSDRRRHRRESCVLSLADVVDPPAERRKRDARLFPAITHWLLDDAARRAAAARAARSVDHGEDGVRIAAAAGAGRPAVGCRMRRR